MEVEVIQNINEELDINSLVKVRQLPIIEEELIVISEKIEADKNYALSLEVNNETVKEVKKVRANINKKFQELEDKRKEVKKVILAPYEEFETMYKKYISNNFNDIDSALSKKINTVENELKEQKREALKKYFDEYLAVKNIDFITFENANINITLSVSMKSLKEQVKDFIDKIEDDLKLIEIQDCKEEIFVDYKKHLNCSRAITTVSERNKAIEKQRIKQLELEEKRKQELERINRIKEETEKQKPLEVPVIQNINVFEKPKIEQPITIDELLEVSFVVRGTIEQLKKLKNFLVDNNYDFE